MSERNTMHIANWGNFPTVDTLSYNQLSIAELASFIRDNHGFIARGKGRSYGDASLSDNPKKTDWLLSVRCVKDAE